MNAVRDAFVEKLKAKMDEWNARIDALEAKARQKESELQMASLTQIEELKAKRRSVEKDLAELKRSGVDAWEDVKAGVEGAAESLDRALQSVQSRFN